MTRKPTGRTGPISVGSNSISRQFIQWPENKPEIERLVADMFCAGNSGMRMQLDRYGHFTDLEQLGENDLDFRVQTGLGPRLLELTEFAPLDQFGNAHANIPGSWDSRQMEALVLATIAKKAAKGYPSGVVLLIYTTHETLFIPVPIIRMVSRKLADASTPFEAIYFLAPTISRNEGYVGSVWEIYPGMPGGPDGPHPDFMHIGFDGFTKTGPI